MSLCSDRWSLLWFGRWGKALSPWPRRAGASPHRFQRYSRRGTESLSGVSLGDQAFSVWFRCFDGDAFAVDW